MREKLIIDLNKKDTDFKCLHYTNKGECFVVELEHTPTGSHCLFFADLPDGIDPDSPCIARAVLHGRNPEGIAIAAGQIGTNFFTNYEIELILADVA